MHGSLAFGCFRWETSDVDFIAVVERPPTLAQKAALIRALLARTPSAPPKGIEMSVMTLAATRSFTHPSPFELHFSKLHLKRCRADVDAYCRALRGNPSGWLRAVRTANRRCLRRRSARSRARQRTSRRRRCNPQR